MPAHGIEHEEASGLPSLASSTNALGGNISASPSVAVLLPHLMRTMADEIETRSFFYPARPAADSPPSPTLVGPLGPVDLRSIAHQVASDLSASLSRQLVTDPGAATTDPADTYDTAGTPKLLTAIRSEKALTGESADPSDHRPSARGRLQLKLLGSPEVVLDGVRQAALERCTRASLVIYILALHPRGLSGERLAAYIASDAPYADAFDREATIGVGAARTFIWRLRKLAGWPDVVVSVGEQGGYQSRYRLPDSTTCDLWEFEASLDEAARLAVRANIEPGAADRAAALRQDAILLYQGEFCKGIGLGAIAQAAGHLRNRYLQAVLLQANYWKDKATRLQVARKEREEYQETGVTAGEPLAPLAPLARLAQLVQEEGAWLQALSNYRLASQVEPYDEAAYAGTMLCQAHLGQSKGIRETLDHCSRVLNAELGRRPLPTTIQTARECLQIASQIASEAVSI